jgi:glycosyltransferase involved in cell wall biosynthesis
VFGRLAYKASIRKAVLSVNYFSLLVLKIKVRLQQSWRMQPMAAFAMGKFYSALGYKVILFTKLHPIYADFSFSQPIKGYRYIFFHPGWVSNAWGKRLLALASVLHADAANVQEKTFDFKGKILIECEGAAQAKWMEDARVSHVIFQSRYAASRNKHTGGLSVVYPAFPGPKKSKTALAQHKTITLLTVGYGCLIKGYDVSFAIFQALKQKGYRIKLIIAGKSEHNFSLYPEGTQKAFDAGNYGAIEDYARLFDDLEIRPFYREELFRDVYPKTFALLHFARMETFGYSILEAMSYGIPVISVNFKAIPEMVAHGVNGYLCNPFDWDGVGEIDEYKMNEPQWAAHCIREGAQYLEALLTNPDLYQQMRIAAYSKSKEFSCEARKNKLVPLLK